MEGLVLRSLQKIRKQVSGSSRRHKPLRDSCDAVIEHLKKQGHVETEGGEGGEGGQDTDADKYFEPFKLACESKSPKIMELALDAIQKLVAYGYLKGTSTVTLSGAGNTMRRSASGDDDEGDGGEGGGRAAEAILMDVIIQTICGCNEQQEDNVQLQMMKALLECVISKNTEVHQASLLLAIRACYNIHLVSRNQVNKTTAKATLTQMLSIIFHRMEAFDQRAREEAQAALQAMEVSSTSTQGGRRAGGGGGGGNSSSSNGLTAAAGGGGGAALVSTTTKAPSSPFPPIGEKKTTPLPPPPPPRPGSSSSNPPPSAPSSSSSDVPRASLPCGAYMYPTVYIKLGYKPQGNRPISLVQRGASSYGTPEFPSVLHKDSYLLFRALCRLSIKGQSEEAVSAQDPVALQSKILSLELLLSILEHAGPTFRTSDKFIYLVRNYLCSSLLKNATSSNTVVVALSLRIFINMISHFKDNLKAEIEVFVSNIFLRLLESENSSYEHKMLVLEVFHNLCQDPQLLIEIFLNYDCDLGATSMFNRIVNALSRVANGRQLTGEVLSSARRTQEEGNLRTAGLEGLVAIAHSLVKSAALDEESGGGGAGGGSGSGGGGGREGGGQAKEVDGGDTSQTGAAGVDKAGGGVASSSSSDDIITTAAAQQPSISSVVDTFDRKQKLQEEITIGVLKFNLKPSSGLAYLESRGHLKHDPADVAHFLHLHVDKLDKTVIGDYLGKEKEYQEGFCVKVLHEYVDGMDFTRMIFDDAIRHFLSGFRLPGEAQKIDRIMEKFAERYCLQNPAVFPSADTAFILSFSIIMLNTDLHNPSVREDRKMTKEDFLRNNRGIASGSDLPESFLSEIYDNIKRTPISLKEDDDMRAKMQQHQSVMAVENPFLSTLSLDKRRKEAYQREREAMVRSSEALFRQRKKKGDNGGGAVYVTKGTVLSDAYVRPMFEVAWGPILSVLSQVIKSSDDDKMIALSLKGFRHAIRIASHYNNPTARDLLVHTLFKFTTLNEIREIKPRNIECIRTLISIALTDGNHLRESWLDVLQCISQLARLQLLSSGLQTDDVYFPADDHQRTTTSSSRGGGNGGVASAGQGGGGVNAPMLGGQSTMGGGGPHRKKVSTNFADPFKIFSGPSKAEAARQVEEFNAEQIMAQIDQSMVERVFTSSSSLNSEAIQYFVLNLCEVSKLEVNVSQPSPTVAAAYRPARTSDSSNSLDGPQPRVFSLQKLVEVADFNMTSRSRLVWANVWEVLSKHFATVGLHENVAVAMFSIDSLRQLSIKFLYKDELRDFNFQRLFLKPYEVIMSSARTTEIRELILRCIDNIISARAHNIRSGWKSIFTVFSIASMSSDEGIAQFAFDMTDHLFRNHFDLLVFDFVDMVNCLLSFAENRHHLHISLAAISHLQKAAALLADGQVMILNKSASSGSTTTPRSTTTTTSLEDHGAPPATPSTPDTANALTSGESHLQHWWPLLVGLSARVADARLAARTSALEALMNTLRQHGRHFSPQTWKLIYRGVLFPMLESARTDCTVQVVSEYPSHNPRMVVHDESWILTTTETVLRSYVEMLGAFYPVTHAIVPEVLAVFSDCVCQHERETLARISLRVLQDFISLLEGHGEDEDLWDAYCLTLLTITRKNLPDWASLDLIARGGVAGGADEGDDGGGREERKSPAASIRRPPIGTVVKTTYGNGTVTGYSEDGRAQVELPWAKLSMMLVGDGAAGAGLVASTEEEDEEGEGGGRVPSSFSTRAEDLDVDEDDDDDDEDDDDAGGGLLARAGSFSFAMVNNGTIMTQMVVVLLTQQVIKDFLNRCWSSLTEAQFCHMIDALTESIEYACEFNANLGLRERLRTCGLMQPYQGQQHPISTTPSVASTTDIASTSHHSSNHHHHRALNRLPHLLEQTIEGYTILFKLLFKIITTSSSPSLEGSTSSNHSGQKPSSKWDPLPVVERILVRYASEVLQYYSQLEDELHRRAAHRGSLTSAYALNSEVAAYTPLVLLVLRSIRALPLAQFGAHLSWFYPCLSDLTTCRSLEVRREVRATLRDKVAATFALGPPSSSSRQGQQQQQQQSPSVLVSQQQQPLQASHHNKKPTAAPAAAAGPR